MITVPHAANFTILAILAASGTIPGSMLFLVVCIAAAAVWVDYVENRNYKRFVEQQHEFEEEFRRDAEACEDDNAVAMAAMFTAIAALEAMDGDETTPTPTTDSEESTTDSDPTTPKSG